MSVKLEIGSRIVDGSPIGTFSLSARHKGRDIEVTVESPDGTYKTIQERIIPELRSRGLDFHTAVALVNKGLESNKMSPVRLGRKHISA